MKTTLPWTLILMLALGVAVADAGEVRDPIPLYPVASVEFGMTGLELGSVEVSIVAEGESIPAVLFVDEPDSDGFCRFELSCPFDGFGTLQFRDIEHGGNLLSEKSVICGPINENSGAQPTQEAEDLVQITATAVAMTDPPQVVPGRLMSSELLSSGQVSSQSAPGMGLPTTQMDNLFTQETYSFLEQERCVTFGGSCQLCRPSGGVVTCVDVCSNGAPPRIGTICTPEPSSFPPFATPTVTVGTTDASGSRTTTSPFGVNSVSGFATSSSFEMDWDFPGVPLGTPLESIELVAVNAEMTVPTTDFAIGSAQPVLTNSFPSTRPRCDEAVAGTATWTLPGASTNRATILIDPTASCAMSSSQTTTGPSGDTVTISSSSVTGTFEGRFRANATPGAGEFRIRLTAWIPGNYVVPPLPFGICSPAPGNAVQALDRGDDRLVVDVDGSLSDRVSTEVVVVPDEALDTDGLSDDFDIVRFVNRTREYAADALSNGGLGLDDGDDDEVLNDCVLLNRVDRASAELIEVAVNRLAPEVVEADLKVRIGNPLYVGSQWAGPIQWDFQVTIDTSSGSPVASVVGEHGKFPAFELLIDDTPIYSNFPDPVARFDPPPPHHDALDGLLGLLFFNTKSVSLSDIAL